MGEDCKPFGRYISKNSISLGAAGSYALEGLSDALWITSG
jgi:hypothetical protein